MKFLTEDLLKAPEDIAEKVINSDKACFIGKRRTLPTIEQGARTSQFRDHMVIMEKPLEEKFDDFVEAIKDIP